MSTKRKVQQQENPLSIYQYLLPSHLYEIQNGFLTLQEAVNSVCAAKGNLISVVVSDNGNPEESINTMIGCLGGHEWVSDNIYDISEANVIVSRYPPPYSYPVMVVGSYPLNTDITNQYHFTSERGSYFCSLLRKTGFFRPMEIQRESKALTNASKTITLYTPIVKTYVTSAIKFNIESLPYHNPRQEHWSGYLFFEVKACNPKVVLLLGKEAIWFFLRPLAKFGLVKYYGTDIFLKASQVNTQLIGRVLECQLPDKSNNILVFCAGNPNTLFKNPDAPPAKLFIRHMHRFTELVKTVFKNSSDNILDTQSKISIIEKDVEYSVIASDERIDEFLHNINEKQLKFDCVSLDCEWSGRNPYAPNARLRTIQFSLLLYKTDNPAKKHVRTFVACYTDAEGNVLISKNKLIELLNCVLRNKVIFAHFGQTDAQWIFSLDESFRDCFVTPDYWEFQERVLSLKGPLYLDTSVLAHTINESISYDLNNLIQLFLNVPQYDEQLKQYSSHDGYASIPDHVLLPYAAKDAFYTLQLGLKLLSFIIKNNEDKIAKISTEHWNEPPYRWKYVHDLLCLWSTMRCYPALIEIMCNGMHLDVQKFVKLCESYEQTLLEILSEIRRTINWDTFNPKSVVEVRTVLFGKEFYNLKNRSLPPNIYTLNLIPVYPTNSTFKEWSDLTEEEKKNAQPSTSSDVLDILYTRNKGNDLATKVIKLLVDYRTIDHVINNFAYGPRRDESGHYVMVNGKYVFDQGYGSLMDYDGRVRSFYKPLNKTGRWSSSPNLMNLPKDAENRYKSILKDKYFCSLRNVFTVADDNWVFLECDIKAAEMYVMAALSQDEELLEDLRKSELPPDSPDYRDIHSYNAVVAFQLNCPPTKEGLKSIGKLGLRHAAKRIIYGAAYGQTLEAAYTMISVEDSTITFEEVQRVREAIFGRYYRLCAWLERAAKLGERGLILINPYGRKRRFRLEGGGRNQISPYLASQFSREAKNFPIQSAVADLMNQSLGWLISHRQECPSPFRIVNFVHDSILMEVPESGVEDVKQFLTRCFRENCIPIRDFQDGELLNPNPLYLSLDFSVSKQWQ